jgi:hypothetical protein
VSPSDWPLSTCRLLDGDFGEVCTWIGWEFHEWMHDLPNRNSAFPYRLQISTPPDELYEYVIQPGADVYDAIYDIIVSIDKSASRISTPS